MISQMTPGNEKLGQIQARYELEMDMESIGRLCAEHGLQL